MQGATPPSLECLELVRDFGPLRAVDRVSFSVRPGEIYGLLGPNGAGKTTTLSLAAGLLPPSSGRVRLAGRDPRAGRELLGVVPQEIALYDELTGEENLRLFGRLHGVGGPELRRRVGEILARLELTGAARRIVGTYSVGMRRRLNLGAALIHRPRLLMLDEPTAGIDPQGREAVLGLVGELVAGGTAVLYTTHYLEEAERLCHRVGILDHGRLLAEGAPAELVRSLGGGQRVTLSGRWNPEGLQAAAAGSGATLMDQQPMAAEGRQARLVLPRQEGAVGQLLAAVLRDGARLDQVETGQADLNTLFLHLTGREVRD